MNWKAGILIITVILAVVLIGALPALAQRPEPTDLYLRAGSGPSTGLDTGRGPSWSAPANTGRLAGQSKLERQDRPALPPGGSRIRVIRGEVAAVDPLAGRLTVESGWKMPPFSRPMPVEGPARTWGNDLSPRAPIFNPTPKSTELVTVATDATTVYRVAGPGQAGQRGVTTGNRVIVVMQINGDSQNMGLARSVTVLPSYVAGER